MLRASIHRQLHDIASARELLSEHVIDGHDATEFKGHLMEDWAPPFARYEKAVCAWIESGEGTEVKIDPTLRKEKMHECRKLLTEVANWGAYDLSARLGIKITTGLDTLKKYGVTV